MIRDILPPGTRPHLGLVVGASAGSVARATALLRHLRTPVTVLSSAELTDPVFAGHRQVRLPVPMLAGASFVDPSVPGQIDRRVAATMVAWLESANPQLVVVDGEPEIAVLTGLLGIPTVPVRRLGRRDGIGHGALDHAAAAWLAPYPAVLEPADSSPRERRRTVHTGLLSPLEGQRSRSRVARRQLGLPENGRHVTIMSGSDGIGVGRGEIQAMAAVCTAWTFTVLGRCGGPSLDAATDRVHIAGWTADPAPHLAAADVVITGGSLSAVSDVAALRRPVAVLPRDSGDGEERRLARALEGVNAAAVLDGWPATTAWPALLCELLDLDARPLRQLSDGRGARRAANWIDAWALSPPSDPEASSFPSVPEASSFPSVPIMGPAPAHPVLDPAAQLSAAGDP